MYVCMYVRAVDKVNKRWWSHPLIINYANEL